MEYIKIIDPESKELLGYSRILEINKSKNIDKTNNISTIPIDENNTDYQELLKWVAEGNTIKESE